MQHFQEPENAEEQYDRIDGAMESLDVFPKHAGVIDSAVREAFIIGITP